MLNDLKTKWGELLLFTNIDRISSEPTPTPDIACASGLTAQAKKRTWIWRPNPQMLRSRPYQGKLAQLASASLAYLITFVCLGVPFLLG